MHDIGWSNLLPLAVTIGLLLLVSATSGAWRRILLPLYVAGLMIFYVTWRATYALDGPGIGPASQIFIVVFFAIEILGLLDALLLLFILTREKDRSAEADRHVAKLASLSPESLPAVDVFIPTYNEPIEVLERSIFAAKALDWPNFKVWVLDDGRRQWLQEFCERNKVGYLTRPTNEEAKAGNINAALARTSAPFFAVFDADFAPRANFLKRTMGFFDDPRIGIVQTPHHFFNPDPLQQNLLLSRVIPDEQRFFFNTIMPARDAWDLAFCCGSNSITRRAALDAVGGRLPPGSITEDIHLTLVLLRKGYITRFLNEDLAVGLAPENTDAFFVQRARWAKGAIQLMFLRTGPFGPGLTLFQRLAFLPTHWLTMGLVHALCHLAPIIFMWTGVTPIANIDARDVVERQIPTIIGVMGAFRLLSKGRYHPLQSMVTNTFMTFRLLPAVLEALLRPFHGGFRVTPKGRLAKSGDTDNLIVQGCAILIALLTGGLLINSFPQSRVISQEAFVPVVAGWAVVNCVVLLLVAVVAVNRPSRREQERFDMGGMGVVFEPEGGPPRQARLLDLSLSGAGITLDGQLPFAEAGILRIPGIPPLRASVVRSRGEYLGLKFDTPDEPTRETITRIIFSEYRVPMLAAAAMRGTTREMLRCVFLPDRTG